MSFPSRFYMIIILFGFFCLSISRIRHVALKKKQFALLLLHHEYTAKKVSSDQKRRNRSQNLLFRFFFLHNGNLSSFSFTRPEAIPTVTESIWITMWVALLHHLVLWLYSDHRNWEFLGVE